jgi:trans-o-hydroxybenzylidenepyruvate hydratase-aldolase
MRQRPRMTADDIHGAWAILPTPATPDGSDWRCENTVDLDETARVVEELIRSGIDGLLSLGTFGECATLTWEEKRAFMRTVVETARGRVPFFAGTTALHTREVVRQNRAALDLGVDGTMLGLPMWCKLDIAGAVQFYRDVAEACPELAICIYANSEAFKFEFPRPFWAQVARIPQVVAAKYLGIGMLATDLRITEGRIRFMPLDEDYYAAARVAPENVTAFWSGAATCGPAVVTTLRDEVARAKTTGDWAGAKTISDAMARTVSTFFPLGSFAEFSKYNIGLEKARMDAAKWMHAGPPRPPYHLVPEQYLEGARIAGRAWAALHEEYTELSTVGFAQ